LKPVWRKRRRASAPRSLELPARRCKIDRSRSEIPESPLRRSTLPNGLEVAYQSKPELLQFYADIFEKRIYTRGGIALRDGDCVFDVGANIGMFTLFVAHRYPHARVFAFEPAPPLFTILQANTAAFGDRVQLFPCGLSRRAGAADLTFYPHSSGMSSFYPNQEEERAALRALIRNELAQGKPGVQELLRYEDELLEQRFRSETWSCPLKTLSQVVREEGVTRIGLLKVDVEKSEVDVLAGIAPEDWGKIEQVALEAHDLEGRLGEIKELLRSRGFAVACEQDELYQGSDRYNLYAVREPRRAVEPGLVGRRPEPAIGLDRIAGRAQQVRGAAREKLKKI
jgi:FkbM family methyltransferase